MKKIIALTSLIMLAGSTAVYAKDATAIATGKNVAKSEASEKIDMKDVRLPFLKVSEQVETILVECIFSSVL